MHLLIVVNMLIIDIQEIHASSTNKKIKAATEGESTVDESKDLSKTVEPEKKKKKYFNPKLTAIIIDG